MRKFGLIGKKLGHSFSKKFFSEKFKNEDIDAEYELYELENIQQFEELKKDPDLVGLNVTIPYKEEIIPFLDELNPTAQAIGAVNTVKFVRKGDKTLLKGYNTDMIGFKESFTPHLKPIHNKAIILGTGGASKAVRYVLNELGIESKFVSRSPKEGQFSYDELNAEILQEYNIIINCSPIGMFPNIDDAPNIPYQYLNDKNYLYDLIYNPLLTRFCEIGEKQGATIQNGLEMLQGQAIASWKIWNE